MQAPNQVQLLRHATIVLTLNGKKLLVDPMLAPKDAFDPIPNAGNEMRIPMVDLPLDQTALEALLTEVDAVFVTHTHPDHWDPTAIELIDKSKPLFVQPPDEATIKGQGFDNVTVVHEQAQFEGIAITRFGGVHGTGKMAEMMGPVSGFVFGHDGLNVYVAGDTIWHSEVQRALDTLKPQYTILNAGAAEFLEGGPITMTAQDIAQVHQQAPNTKIIAIHMDTVNHCNLKRTDLQQVVAEQSLTGTVLIPADGEAIPF